MTLELFFEQDSFRWTDAHITSLREKWKDMKQHKLFQFNKEWYSKIFENCNNATLDYYVSLKIPHFSGWAEDERKSRDTVSVLVKRIT
jgi:hypothetical protein